MDQAVSPRLVLDACGARHFVWQTNPPGLVESDLDGFAADKSFQDAFLRVVVRKRVNICFHLRHFGRWQNAQASPRLMLRPEHQGQFSPVFFRPPLGRNLDAPLLVHSMPVERIVVTRPSWPCGTHLFTSNLKMLQSPTTLHFYPL